MACVNEKLRTGAIVTNAYTAYVTVECLTNGDNAYMALTKCVLRLYASNKYQADRCLYGMCQGKKKVEDAC